MTPDPFAPPSRKRTAVSLVVATATTVVGCSLLAAAVKTGADPPEFLLVLGVTLGLSGIIWWCTSHIRGDRNRGRTDYSALLILALVGVAGAGWGMAHGRPLHEVLLHSGMALVTVWMFCALEARFVLNEKNRLPLLAKILIAPVYPFYWLLIRQAPNPAGPLDDVGSLLNEERIDAELASWDADSDFRVPGRVDDEFEATEGDAARNLDVTFPAEMVAWMADHAGTESEQADGSTLTVWDWAAIAHHPVDLPNRVVVFAQQRRIGSDPGKGPQYALVVDLRPGRFEGAVMRGLLRPGSRLNWHIVEPLEPVSASFDCWRRFCVA